MRLLTMMAATLLAFSPLGAEARLRTYKGIFTTKSPPPSVYQSSCDSIYGPISISSNPSTILTVRAIVGTQWWLPTWPKTMADILDRDCDPTQATNGWKSLYSEAWLDPYDLSNSFNTDGDIFNGDRFCLFMTETPHGCEYKTQEFAGTGTYSHTYCTNILVSLFMECDRPGDDHKLQVLTYLLLELTTYRRYLL